MIHRTYLPAKNSQRTITSQHSHIVTDNNLRTSIIKCNYMGQCRVGYPHVSIELSLFGFDDDWGFLRYRGV